MNELLDIKSNRGIRLSQGIPVRSQRTHTNAKTIKKLKKIFVSKQPSRNKRPLKIQKKKKKKNIIR